MREKEHEVDFCVVGGGLAGMCAAISAARHGVRVALMQDRPVLGGNASSEIRMWVCGAHGENNRETGILEEIMLENLYRNPQRSYSIWDSILYEKVQFEDNMTLLLNCSCNDLGVEGGRIRSVRGWQMTTETHHEVKARLFLDASGDGILAPLSKAGFRMGREGRDEYNEDIAPDEPDQKTMGMSCLIQARETPQPQRFIPPAWAHRYASDAALPHRNHDVERSNFWWIELGGEQHSIHDTEEVRDELLKVAFGVWDHIKNCGEHGAKNWALDWIGFLPGKRESRRYLGDHVLTQNDIRDEGKHFEDVVAYGGWSMDDHHPGGIEHPGPPTVFHPAPSPYGIPYRSLYSRDVENLFCAGRNISATHAAMSSTRVMGTCAVLGQAVGTAASLCVERDVWPRDLYPGAIDDLKQRLMDDDCYLPWQERKIPRLTRAADLTAGSGDPESLRSGCDRPCAGRENVWTGRIGDAVLYSFGSPQRVESCRFVFDSDLNRAGHNMPCRYTRQEEFSGVPRTMLRAFRLEIMRENGGDWEPLLHVDNNYQRLVRVNAGVRVAAIRFVPIATWGDDAVRVFGWELR